MIDEAVLYRPFGSAAIMTAQLLKLQELADRPDISIKVVPLAQGPARRCAARSRFWSSTSYPDVLFMEGPRGDINVYEQEATAARRGTWTALETQLASEPLSTTTYEGRLTSYSARLPTPHGQDRTRCLHSLGLRGAPSPSLRLAARPS